MQEQHLATRRSAGLFDFSFMSLCEITGSGAREFLERLQTRSLARLEPGQIIYTLVLREDAAVFIDATLWLHDDGRWWLFTGRRSDPAWIVQHTAGFDARVRDRSGEFSVLALQGPASGRILSRLIGTNAVLALEYFHFTKHDSMIVARLGYSGELGYEVLLPAADAGAVRKALDVPECSFDTANSLRIESGYVLFDREIIGHENPFELGLERLVNLDGRDFIGRQAFAVLRRSPPARRLAGLEISDRNASPLLPLARVTSECDSPIFRRHVALGFAPSEVHCGDLARLADGRLARIVRLPFYDPGRRMPRAAPL